MGTLYSMQPLFPFIEIKIGKKLITSFTDSMVDCVIDMTYKRTAESAGGGTAGNEWSITMYDDTAINVEYLLNQASDGEMSISYGFARDA